MQRNQRELEELLKQNTLLNTRHESILRNLRAETKVKMELFAALGEKCCDITVFVNAPPWNKPNKTRHVFVRELHILSINCITQRIKHFLEHLYHYPGN